MSGKGIYDIHCHIVPGVDDGATDIEEISRFDEIIHSMAHLIIEFSQGGGFDNTDNQYG